MTGLAVAVHHHVSNGQGTALAIIVALIIIAKLWPGGGSNGNGGRR